MIKYEVAQFDTEISRDGHNGYDVHVTINGERQLIAFALPGSKSRPGGTGYHFCTLGNQFGKLAGQADLFDHFTPDGLTLAEVKQRGHIVAGLYLAAKAVSDE